MITPFNRVELLITYKADCLNRAHSALAAADIDYTCLSQDMAGPTFRSPWGRAGVSSTGPGSLVEYKLYVRRKDLERAQAVIQGV